MNIHCITHMARVTRISFVVITFGFALAFLGCGSTKDEVVAKVGDYNLTLDEYEKQFIRNNGGKAAAIASTMDERKDFLNLLIKYRLKVLDAKGKGFNTDPEIQKELREYRNSLALPYLTERALIDQKIEQLYKRRLEEVRVAHILIRPQIDSLGIADTISAFNEAKHVLSLALKGERFDSLAAQYSHDPGTAKSGGDLMYFTAGMTAPSFDDAIYTLQPGQVYSELVRTMFGFHIVKMLDRKRSRGEIEVSHILVRTSPENPTDTTAAFEKIRSILDTLKRGGDFNTLAMMNSEDSHSGANGGYLGWVARRKFVPEFEMVAFGMKVGDISNPVKTPFGYHIIKVTGERPGKPFEEARQELKDLYRRYGFEEDNKEFIASIEKKHRVQINDATIDILAKNLDTTSTTSAPGWYNNIPDHVKSLPLITLKTKTVSVDEAIKTIERNRDLQSKPLNRKALHELASIIGQKEALQIETENLEQRYPEFGDLMQEYKEGVLLFRAEQEAVWNKVSVNEEELKNFWAERKADFRWPDRVAFREIFVTSDSLAKSLRDSLNRGIDFAKLAERHTQRAGYKEKQGEWGLQPEGANDLSKKAMTMEPGWIEGPMKFQYGFSIIKVDAKEKAREKTFEEAQSEVSSKFQEHESKRLEKEWIESLGNQYGVHVYHNILKNAFENLKN